MILWTVKVSLIFFCDCNLKFILIYQIQNIHYSHLIEIYRHLNTVWLIYMVAQKECNTYDQQFQENDGQSENVACIIVYKNLLAARWHQDRQFWWRRVDSMAVFLTEAMSFSRFALLSQKSQFAYRKFAIVWLSRVKCLLLLCNAEPPWIKKNKSLRNFAALLSGGATQRNSSLPQTWLLIQKERIFKMTLTQKNGSKIKTPSSKSLILVLFLLEKECSTHYCTH